jgi:serine protease Do
VRATLPYGSRSGNNDPSSVRRFLREFGAQKGDPEDAPGAERSAGQPALVSQGAGFFISSDGYLATNHDLVENSTTVEILTDENKTFVASVVGKDPRSGLALLKVDGKEPGKDFAHVRFADRAPRVGEWVIAVGNSFGLGSTVTAGVVSARGRDIGPDTYQDLLQIDAPVNRGSSGGPVFNAGGEVIGVMTAIVSPGGGSVGIAFAVPADEAGKVVSQLRSSGAVTRGWIGLQVIPITPQIADRLGLNAVKGVLAAEARTGGPAATAGIKAGDVITSFDDKPVTDTRDFTRRIADTPPGTAVTLTVLRKGEPTRITVELRQSPRQDPRGAAMQPTPGLARVLAGFLR